MYKIMNKSDLKELLKKAGCFAIEDTKDGFKCEFDGNLQRFHIFCNEHWTAELGPFTLYAGGVNLNEIESIISRLKK